LGEGRGSEQGTAGQQHADEQCDERAASHSITSSVTASRVGGTVIPNARAVCILMTNSNFVGCNTGKFADFSPLRTRPT
jgi:hypothetical protein